MMNFGPLSAEIGPVVWGIPANFNGFHVLSALLHGTPVLGVSQICGVEQEAPAIQLDTTGSLRCNWLIILALF